MSAIDDVEWASRRLGAIVAISAAALAAPAVARSAFVHGAVAGRPELVFTPWRLLGISLGWFGLAAVTWRPLPVRPSPRARLLLLAGGMALYLVGLGLAMAGRLALAASYRPSSTMGAALAPDHRLVTSGPYAVLRHPMYVGLALAAIGALAVYRTWTTLLFVAQLQVLVVRARQEEALLARVFGQSWRAYADRVPAWLSRTWSRSRSVGSNSRTEC